MWCYKNKWLTHKLTVFLKWKNKYTEKIIKMDVKLGALKIP